MGAAVESAGDGVKLRIGAAAGRAAGLGVDKAFMAQQLQHEAEKESFGIPALGKLVQIGAEELIEERSGLTGHLGGGQGFCHSTGGMKLGVLFSKLEVLAFQGEVAAAE